MDKKLISIVIPCYNEEKNINRTLDALLDLTSDHKYNFEILPVNDGSKDNTWGVIKDYAQKHDKIIGINQMTNYGQSAAYQAGFDNAKGDYVVIFSGDLEVPVENINTVIDYLDEGYDFVNTNRMDRWGGEKDGDASRGVKSGLANKIIAKISKVEMQDRGSGLKGFRKNVLDNLRFYGEMHRFIPDYLSVYGAKMIEFDVEFKDREYGESAYTGSNRTVRVLLDLMTLAFMLYFAKKPFYAMPGRLFGFTGAIIAGLGVLINMYLVALKLVTGADIGGRPLLTAGVLMVIVGVQSVMMGMLGELLLRIYFESSDRKTYSTREIVK